MSRKGLTAGFGAIAKYTWIAAATAWGCGGSADPLPDPTGSAESDVVVCSDGAPTTANGAPKEEWYHLVALNHTLQYYPDFAASVGLRSVRSCAEARAFVAGYERYSLEHPGFDADEPLPDALPIPPSPRE